MGELEDLMSGRYQVRNDAIQEDITRLEAQRETLRATLAKEQAMGLEKVSVEEILKARVAQKEADAAAGKKPEKLWNFDN